MNGAALLAVTLVAVVVVLDCVVSVAVVRSQYYSTMQKAAQVVLVWLLPIVGAIVVGVFLYSQRDNPIFDTRAYPEPEEKAVSYVVYESIQGHDHAP